jgi:hypothetical protein
MQTRQSKPSRLFVDIWVERQGRDVTALNQGEPALACHIRLRSVRKPVRTVYLKSVAFGTAAAANAPLVWFTHANRLEWICSVKTSISQAGVDHHPIDVEQNNNGATTIQALELLICDPFGVSKETVTLNLPLSVT